MSQDTSKKARELELIREFERFNFKHVNFEYHDEENFAYQTDVVKAISELIDLREAYEDLKQQALKMREALAELSKRHEWQPEMGQCICEQHRSARQALEQFDEFMKEGK